MRFAGTYPRRAGAAVLAAALLAAGPVAPAQAGAVDKTAPTIHSVTLSPGEVVLPKSKKKRRTVTVTARVTDDTGVRRVLVGLYDPKERDNQAVRLRRATGSGQDGTWTGRIRVGTSRRVGTYTLRAMATDEASRSTDPTRVYSWLPVRDKTRVAGFNVAEPVAVGAPVEITGTLQRWKAGKKWRAYRGRELVVEFRPDGAGDFAPVGTATTDSDGRIEPTGIRATGTGQWRVRFAGTSTRAPATSRSDTVTANG